MKKVHHKAVWVGLRAWPLCWKEVQEKIEYKISNDINKVTCKKCLAQLKSKTQKKDR